MSTEDYLWGDFAEWLDTFETAKPSAYEAYRIGFAAGQAAQRAADAAICDRGKEVASWSDQTDYYRGRGDEASDCALEIREAANLPAPADSERP